ncbi:hypothetical protein NUW58_g7614 [Xylaria curta]|uniref:Uncharacterized protein n=1 Tax=Xylaria curta TaxID=42375 RepID=A0ACC1NGF2_9PEZI|nr:hypothetical protein NUW58_g7614 [Xylaria curta]
MRLINTHTSEFKEFYGDQIPRYAILSHTWQQGEEVTFQEWLRWEKDVLVRKKSGFDKIRRACRLARRDSLDWAWVDTSCIDKTSSAELTEAINSMYEWYRKSAICYAYLSDVSIIPAKEDDQEFIYEFSKSRWWTRGWTLQELLAPTKVIFLTRAWKTINSRPSLARTIQHISGISETFLDGTTSPQMAYAGQKMSWLSKRETTRVEDMAYCMLGLFEINMPLLYGEGRKAFWRLQEEIIKVSNDHTIFCWTWTKTVPKTWVHMLAPWPDTFVDSSQFISVLPPRCDTILMPVPYAMTNVGLSIQLPVFYTLNSWFVCLNVRFEGGSQGAYAGVRVAELGANRGLRRCWFPAGPIQLLRDAIEKHDSGEERTYNFIIGSRFSHFYNFGEECHMPPTSSLPQPVVVQADLQGWRFTLFPCSHPAHAISLFFAVMEVKKGDEIWYCDIASRDDLESLQSPGFFIKGDFAQQMEARGQAWFQKNLDIFRPLELGAR